MKDLRSIAATSEKADTLLVDFPEEKNGPLLHFRVQGLLAFSQQPSEGILRMFVLSNDRVLQQCDHYLNSFARKDSLIPFQYGFELDRGIEQFDQVKLILSAGKEHIQMTNLSAEWIRQNPAPEFHESGHP